MYVKKYVEYIFYSYFKKIKCTGQSQKVFWLVLSSLFFKEN